MPTQLPVMEVPKQTLQAVNTKRGVKVNKYEEYLMFVSKQCDIIQQSVTEYSPPLSVKKTFIE